MRIIGGELRGRRIAAPAGRGTRPMLDRVREAMFSTLAPWLGGALVLDLFAGSGSLGLEALSRGGARARLVESDPRTARVLRGNVDQLGLAERVEILTGDALAPSIWGGEAFDLVFLDPPYVMLEDSALRGRVLQALGLLLAQLAPEGVVVLHTPRAAIAPHELFGEARVRRYGTNELWYVQREEER